MKIFRVLILFLSLILSGCSTTSNGISLGFHGSPKWHEKASTEEIASYWQSRSLRQLKKSFNRNVDNYRYKRGVFDEIERREGNPSEVLMGDMPMALLHQKWIDSYKNATDRHFITIELKRRGFDPQLFYDADLDARLLVADRIEAIKRKERRAERTSNLLKTQENANGGSMIIYNGLKSKTCTKIGINIFCN